MRSKDPDTMNQIAEYVTDYIRTRRRTPSVRDIAAGTGISRATTQRYLVAMNEMGMLEYDGGVQPSESVTKCSSEYCPVPIVGNIQCGEPLLEEENITEYILLPASIFGKGDLFIVQAKGDSMVDAGISEGDYVVVKRQPTAETGDLVVGLNDENENTLKRYSGYDKESGMHTLDYMNESVYPGKTIKVKQLVVQGVAKHVIKAL